MYNLARIVTANTVIDEDVEDCINVKIVLKESNK
jgi:hypothetical protein